MSDKKKNRGLFGAKTSKRWNMTKWLAVLITMTGWGSMGVCLYFLMLEQFVTLSITTMTVLAGLNGVYNFAETYRPHIPPVDVEATQTIQQSNVTVEVQPPPPPVTDTGEVLPSKPSQWVES